MKKLVPLVALFFFVSGCTGLPGGGFGGMFGGFTEEKEGPRDVITVSDMKVIPDQPIAAGSEFLLTFYLNNKEDKDVENVEIEPIDFGQCKLENGYDKERWAKTMYPGSTEVVEWKFTAPSNENLGGMSGKCDIRFDMSYDFKAYTRADAIVASNEKMIQASRSGESLEANPQEVKSRGPIKLDVEFENKQPFREGMVVPFTVKIYDKGSGHTSIPKSDLDITLDGIHDGSEDSFSCNYPTSKGNIPLINRESPPIRCRFVAEADTGMKTHTIKLELPYTYTVSKKQTVDIKPTAGEGITLPPAEEEKPPEEKAEYPWITPKENIFAPTEDTKESTPEFTYTESHSTKDCNRDNLEKCKKVSLKLKIGSYEDEDYLPGNRVLDITGEPTIKNKKINEIYNPIKIDGMEIINVTDSLFIYDRYPAYGKGEKDDNDKLAIYSTELRKPNRHYNLTFYIKETKFEESKSIDIPVKIPVELGYHDVEVNDGTADYIKVFEGKEIIDITIKDKDYTNTVKLGVDEDKTVRFGDLGSCKIGIKEGDHIETEDGYDCEDQLEINNCEGKIFQEVADDVCNEGDQRYYITGQKNCLWNSFIGAIGDTEESENNMETDKYYKVLKSGENDDYGIEKNDYLYVKLISEGEGKCKDRQYEFEFDIKNL